MLTLRKVGVGTIAVATMQANLFVCLAHKPHLS